MTRFENIAGLYTALQNASRLAHEAYDRTRGKRGGRGCDFSMGYYAALDLVIETIKTGDTVDMDNCCWEVRGYRVKKDGTPEVK